jgi:hypothetical protein
MSEVYEHNPNPADHEDPLPGPTVLMGLVGVLLLTIILLGLTALYYDTKEEEEREAVWRTAREDVLKLRQAQEALLEGPPRRVVRDEGGRAVEAIVIPVERAMELIVAEEASR